jgi:glucosamine kinase
LLVESNIVVGIDAGGSGTRARAMMRDRVIYDGTGGPGNPMAADEKTLRSSYMSALEGCPQATHVAACVAGAASAGQRARISRLLSGRFPDAVIQVMPDYIAAFAAAPDGTDVAVVAGTGSVVCSRDPDGAYATSGGRGWIVGDHGSAARLGRAVLERFCDDPSAASPVFAAGVREAIGHSDWRGIVSSLSTTQNPAALLARAAPLLTAAAADGAGWAVEVLEAEMTALAEMTTRHIRRSLPSEAAARVALAGGVWNSHVAVSAFRIAMRQDCPVPTIILRSTLDPIAGAARIAASMDS